MQSLREYIQEYHDRGWNVVPLARGTKVPIKGISVEKYFETRFPNDELLNIVESQEINLGIITGKTSNLSVIDIDVSDPIIRNNYLSQYPTDLIQFTPSGGSHLFYDYDPTFPEIRKFEHGDFFAGKHYVVVSPSIFGNRAYEWLKFGNTGKLSRDIFTEHIQLQTGKYTRQEILELLNYAVRNGTFKDGQWNDSILYISTVLAGDGWDKEATYYFLNSINVKGDKPIPEKHVRGMIDRAFEYASKHNYTKPENQGQKHVRHTELMISSYGEIMSQYIDHKSSWMVEGWILESSVMICAAPPERYKTWLSVDLSLSVATGTPFLNHYDVLKTGNVLILQQEDFGPRYFSRFNAVERSKLSTYEFEIIIEEIQGGYSYYTEYDVSDKIFFHTDAEFTLDNEEAIQRLEERIVETGSILCIIDPFYSIGGSDDYFATTAQKIRERIKNIRNKTGCAFLFIHHTRKTGTTDNGDNFTRNNIFGSQLVSAVMEGTWIVGRTQGMGNTEVNVYRRFKDENAPPVTRIVFHINMTAENDLEAYSLEVEDVAEDLFEELKEHLRNKGPQSFTELNNIFGERFTSKSAFTRWLRSKVDNGITQDGKKGKYSVEPGS